MEDLFVLLAVLAGIAIAILLIIYVILPLSLILFIGIVATATISGFGVAAYNFGSIVIEAHKTLPK